MRTSVLLAGLVVAGCGGGQSADKGDSTAQRMKRDAKEAVAEVERAGEVVAEKAGAVAKEAAAEVVAVGKKIDRRVEAAAADVGRAIDGDAPRERPAPGPVTGAQARALVADGARLVDVRTSEEFAAGRVDGALNVPVDDLEARLGELPDREAPLVVYCASGRRSARAAALLGEKGYTRVYDLGAMSNW